MHLLHLQLLTDDVIYFTLHSLLHINNRGEKSNMNVDSIKETMAKFGKEIMDGRTILSNPV